MSAMSKRLLVVLVVFAGFAFAVRPAHARSRDSVANGAVIGAVSVQGRASASRAVLSRGGSRRTATANADSARGLAGIAGVLVKWRW